MNKILIYELFSGVGFCNQLFSLETGIYLANITNRKLILLIRNPLCHCGKSNWNYGKILDFFDDNYLKYLPYGIEVYYGNPPNKILKILDDSEKFKISNGKKFSSVIFVDKELYNENNKVDISKFANARNIEIIDYNTLNKHTYLYISQSNASRCFYNFYTTKENYIIMNKICNSLNILKPSFYHIINSIKLPENFNSIHFRFGDKHWEPTRIKFLNQKTLTNNSDIWDNTINYITGILKKQPIIIMTDNNSHYIFSKLKNEYKILFSENLYDINLVKKYFNENDLSVVYFLLEKLICQKANIFIGSEESTVSNHINYNNFLNNKSHNYLLNKTIKQGKYTWILNNYNGPGISWRVFFPENVYII